MIDVFPTTPQLFAASSPVSLGWEFLSDAANWSGPGGIPQRLLEHIGYSLGALLIAAVIAVPVGLLVGHTGRGRVGVLALSGMLRAVPILGLLTLLALFVGLGLLPAYVALVILAIPPILGATAVGVSDIDPLLIESSRAMGLTELQTLRRTEIPLALPVIVTGLRSSLLQLVASVPVIAILPLGGLGRFIIDGLQQNEYGEVLIGAVLVALLALCLDLLFAALEKVWGALKRLSDRRQSTLTHVRS